MILGKMLLGGSEKKEFVAFVRNTWVSNAQEIVLSDDYGETFEVVGDELDYRDIAVSENGDIMIACVYGGYMYVSYDYGQSWTQKGSSRNHTCVAISSDGKYMFCGATNRYMRSSDYGVNFTDVAANPMLEIACSTDGQYVTFVISSYVFVSSDYGSTFTSTALADCQSVAMSEDGQYQVVGRAAYCYTSDDYGATWTELASPAPAGMVGVAMSADGSFIAGINTDGWVYYSTNWWVTWYSFSLGSSYTGAWSIACSKQKIDGSYLLYATRLLSQFMIENYNTVTELSLPQADDRARGSDRVRLNF